MTRCAIQHSVAQQPFGCVTTQRPALRRKAQHLCRARCAELRALAHWLVGGVDGGRLFVRVFDGAAKVRENIAGHVLASGTTMQWNSPAKGWNAGAVMADASLNRRQTIRVGAGVAFAQIRIVGFDGQIELEALRLFGLSARL